MKNYKKGFTLIELLVVVAIIGVLASVVLASLNTARAKGADTSIKANLANLRAAAEMLYDSYSCYTSTNTCSASSPVVINTTGGTCAVANGIAAPHIFANAAFYSGITAALTSSGGLGSCSATVAGTAWAVAVTLKADTTKAWCVDSTGASKQVALADGTQASINLKVTGGACSAS